MSLTTRLASVRVAGPGTRPSPAGPPLPGVRASPARVPFDPGADGGPRLVRGRAANPIRAAPAGAPKPAPHLVRDEGTPRRAAGGVRCREVPRRAAGGVRCREVPRRAAGGVRCREVPRRAAHGVRRREAPRRAAGGVRCREVPRRAAHGVAAVRRRAPGTTCSAKERRSAKEWPSGTTPGRPPGGCGDGPGRRPRWRPCGPLPAPARRHPRR